MIWVGGAIALALFMIHSSLVRIGNELRHLRDEISDVSKTANGESSIVDQLSALRSVLNEQNWRLSREERALDGDWLEKLKRNIESREQDSDPD